MRPPAPEWGMMMAEGREFLSNGWWVAAMPGFACLYTGLAFILLGDGVADLLRVKGSEQVAADRSGSTTTAATVPAGRRGPSGRDPDAARHGARGPGRQLPRGAGRDVRARRRVRLREDDDLPRDRPARPPAGAHHRRAGHVRGPRPGPALPSPRAGARPGSRRGDGLPGPHDRAESGAERRAADHRGPAGRRRDRVAARPGGGAAPPRRHRRIRSAVWAPTRTSCRADSASG